MDLQCQFNNGVSKLYTCFVTNASITEPKTRIKSITGEHLEGKNDNDVEGIYFNHTVVEYFPRGLIDLFPRLRSLWILGSGLKTISREDLSGFENLEEFRVVGNKLKSLPSNLFIGMKKLTLISVYGNQLEFVSSELLKPIFTNGMHNVDFRQNTKIDAVFHPNTRRSLTLEQLMKQIDEQCSKPLGEDGKDMKKDAVEISKKQGKNVLSALWRSGKFSDFTIITESKKFRVHKNVLGIQSSVFAEMCKEGTEIDKMEIEVFSADAVEQFLTFLYEDNTPGEKYAIELFALAAEYDVTDLKSICEELVLKSLTEFNAFEIFSLAHLYPTALMKRKAFDEIKKTIGGIQLSDDLIDDPERLEKIVAAARAPKRKH